MNEKEALRRQWVWFSRDETEMEWDRQTWGEARSRLCPRVVSGQHWDRSMKFGVYFMLGLHLHSDELGLFQVLRSPVAYGPYTAWQV